MTSRYYLLLALVILTVATALSARAYPTLYGDTGYAITPTADTLRYTQFDIAADYTRVRTVGDESVALPVRLNYGIAPGAELFATLSLSSENGFDAMGAGAKFQLVGEDFTRHIPAVSLGARIVHYHDGDVGNEDVAQVYAVATATLFRVGTQDTQGFQVRGNLGVEYVNFAGPNDANFIAPFVGASYVASSGVTLAVEYLPELERNGVTFRESTASGVIRFPLSESFLLQLGATRPFARGSNSLIFGFNYHYDADYRLPGRTPTILY